MRRVDRLVVAAVAAAALILIIVLAFVLGGGDDGDGEAGLTTPTVATTDTAPTTTTTTETGPGQEIPEGETLTEGDSGRSVRQLQRALQSLGYAVTPDGDYGPATSEAVAAFQEDSELEADGVAGAETITAINEALAGQG